MTNPKHTDTSRSGDLVERLRSRVSNREILLVDPPRPAPDHLCHEAADRIEALEAEVERLQTQNKALHDAYYSREHHLSYAVMKDERDAVKAENERLRRDKARLLDFARAIQTWRSDADSYDSECDNPQRNYCEDVELMEGVADIVIRQVEARAALGEKQ
jgi:hypothetical protein